MKKILNSVTLQQFEIVKNESLDKVEELRYLCSQLEDYINSFKGDFKQLEGLSDNIEESIGILYNCLNGGYWNNGY